VKFLLLRIGIFAIDGIIFRIHGDRGAAERDVTASTGKISAGPNSNFETSPADQAQSQPTNEPIRPSDQLPATLLAGTVAAAACHHDKEYGELNEKSTVGTTLSVQTINAASAQATTFTATSQLPSYTSNCIPLTSDGDNPQYRRWCSG
jgi:hypothetical protein